MSAGCLKKPSRPPPPPPIEFSTSSSSPFSSPPSSSTSSSSNHHHSYHRNNQPFLYHHQASSSTHLHSNSTSFHHRQHNNNNKNHGSNNSRSDYIKISECHTGLPERPPKPMGFKSRASTSFSSTLKPSTSSYVHSSHQKSRSLTGNHLGSSYLYLDLPSSLNSKNNAPTPPSIVYKTVDFLKTDALNKCKVERTIGRV